jgi:hypothetical protein
MRSNPGPTRVLLRPGQDFGQRLIPVTRQPSRVWYRVHRSAVPAVDFGLLPFHRFSHDRCPHPILYLGASIQTCLWEVFGDDVFQGQRAIALSKWSGRQVSQINVPELAVCALNLAQTRDAAGVDKASLLATDLSIPQAWGLAVQQHSAGFQAIKYSSRFVDQPCLALFDLEGLAGQLKAGRLGDLVDLDTTVDWLHDRKAALVF